MSIVLTFIAAALVTFIGVEFFRRWSVRRKILDIPNERSSHASPTPRGGGLVIVIVVLFGYCAVSYFEPRYFSYSFVTGSILVALVSWLDDLRSVSFVWRLFAHCLAAGFVIFELGSWSIVWIPIAEISMQLGPFGSILTFCWIVWVINAFNFMDGIDGIAALQAIVASALYFILFVFLEMPSLVFVSALIGGAAAGFIVHNWQPAKIFMGDVGSSFLGFVFGVLPLFAIRIDPTISEKLPVFAVAVIWPFVFDTVVTFFRRMLNREPVWRAHRTHLYQRLTIRGWSHAAVSVIFGVFSLVIGSLALIWFFRGGEFGFMLLLVILVLGAFVVILANRTSVEELNG